MKRNITLIGFGIFLVLFASNLSFGTTETLRPNGSGDQTSISSQYPSSGSHYDKVDEVTADDSSTYVYTSSTSYQRDLYNLQNSSVGSGTINSVTVYFRIASSDYGYYAYAKPSLKTHGQVYDGTQVSVYTTSYQTFSQTWTTNPNTSSAWTWAEIDALQAGISLWLSNCTSRCTQVYVVIDYGPSLTPCLLRSYYGPTGDERLGMYVAAGDVNGDGYKDLIIGGPKGSSNYGIVRIYLRGRGMNTGSADAVIGPGSSYSYFYRVASGDIDGDGKDDVVVGASSYPSDQGSVYIFLATTIISDSDHQLSLSQANYVLTGTTTDDNFGHAVWVADVDGDNKDDVIVGAYLADHNPYNSGRVYIFKGQGMTTESSTNADWIITGNTGYYFGYDVNAADIDNNGKADVIIGAPGPDVGVGGKVYIYKGGGALLITGNKTVSDADITINGNDDSNNNNSFGKSVGNAGDVDNDNRDDVIIGALNYSSNTGRAYIFLGSSLTTNKNSGNADYIITGVSGGPYFGVDVSTAGDIDNNGYDDVIIGAAAPIGVSGIPGKAYVFLGNHLTSSMNASSRDYEFTGSGDDNLGFSVGTVGNINSDPGSEWFIGAPLQDGYNNGRVYLWSLDCENPDVQVEVASFEATPQDSAVMLEWKTASEIDNEGFNLLRKEGEKGEYIRINPYFIPAQGESGVGTVYNYTDYNVKDKVTYFYFLESIDIYGQGTLYGPVSTTIQDGIPSWPGEREKVLPKSQELRKKN